MENGLAISRPALPVKRSPDEWRGILRDFEGSGETVKAYCAARGLSPKTFSSWRGRLRGGAPDAAPAFVAVPDPGVSPGWEVELDLGGGAVLRLRRA